MYLRRKSGVRIVSADPDSQRGLTLVEMLIALVLSSIIFISAYQVISNLVQYQVRSRVHQELQIDRLLLKNILTNIIEKSVFEGSFLPFMQINIFCYIIAL